MRSERLRPFHTINSIVVCAWPPKSPDFTALRPRCNGLHLPRTLSELRQVTGQTRLTVSLCCDDWSPILPRKRRRHIPPKHMSQLHGAMTHKTLALHVLCMFYQKPTDYYIRT